MTINRVIIRELEHTYRRTFPADFRKYLIMKYSEEPFPYEFSEQDLFANIRRDLHDYDTGELDTKIISPSARWREEREYLQNLYVEKCHEARSLEEYVGELELMLLEHNLKPSTMLKIQTECEF